MAQGAFEGGVVSIRGDASQVKNELLEVSKLLTELEKNKVKLKPEIDINNVKKDVNKLEQYMQGKFGALDFSQVYSKLMTQVQKNPNKFAEELAKTMRGVNLLEQAVKPEDISKLAAASAQEMFDLVQRLGGLAEGTKPTSNLVTKRLKEIYDKYPNGIEGLSSSGKGGGFGASEETLNKIGETLERIDVNVKSINDSIQTGAITVQAVAESAENVVDKTKQAADAQAELTTETEKTAQAQERLEQAQDKNNGQRQNIIDKKESGKETEKGDSKKGTDSTSLPISNTKSLNDTIKKEGELKQVAEKTNETLKNQQSLKTVSYQDIMSKSISDVASNASKVLQNLNESQKELGNNIQTTTNLLETQNAQIQDTNNKSIIENTTTEINTQQIMFDAFSESAKRAGEIGQKLGQQQNLLANAFQKTTEQIAHQSMFDTFIDGAKQAGEALQQLGQQQDKLLSETFQASQKTNEEYNPKKIIERAGDIDQVQKYIYSISEAEAKLKEIKSRHVNKKDEAKQLNPLEAREVWGALNSLDQISLFGSDEEVERINQIFDQYEEWVERYVTQDPLGTNALDKISALFERMNKYRSAFDKVNTLDQSRELYNLDIEQRNAVMTPDQTIEGYTYAIDRVQVILETMEQYKAAIEKAQSKGQEITEADQKFLNDYEKTKNQWTRAGERAQNNLTSLQEQKRLAEEDKKRIEQRKQEEKERRIARNQLQREDRQTRIEDDQQFETAFQEYKIDDIKNMELDEIEKRITQMEEFKKKAEELRNELIQLKKNIKANDSYKEGKLDEEVIDAMRPTEQEEGWLALYDEQAKKRKEYAQELKKQKNEIKKKQEEEAKAELAKNQTGQDAKQAQDNAKEAEEAAKQAKEAASESDEAVKKTEDAKKRTKKEINQKKDEASVIESADANQTAQKNVKYVTRTKEQLQAQLTMAEQSVVNYKERQEQLQKEIESIQNKTFNANEQTWGHAKTAEEFLANKLLEDNTELEKVNSNLAKKEKSVKNLTGRIKQIESWEEQGFKIQLKEGAQKTVSKKGIAIITNTSDVPSQSYSSDALEQQAEQEKKDGKIADKLKNETQNTNDKLQETKELTDEQKQLLISLFGEDNLNNLKGINNSLGNESNAFSVLIESLKELPTVTEILSNFNTVNSDISKNAQGVADIIQAEANAFSFMTQTTQGVNSKQLIASDKKDTGLLEIGSTGNELKEIEQKKDQYKKITDQIKTIEDDRVRAEEEIARYNISDKNFKVGRSKNKTYDQLKIYAEQLKQDFKAFEKLDPNDTSEKAKEIIAKYENSRVAFSKAFSKMVANGLPKDKGDESVGFWELNNKHGVGSKGFDEAEKNVTDNLKFLEERLKQQKQQAEIILKNLYAERDRFLQELTSTSSQTNIPLNENNSSINKPDLGGGQSANGIHTEGDEAGDAAAKMQALADAKKQVTEANQKLSQSAQQTTDSLNGEAGAGTNTSEALQQEINALKQVSEQQKKTINEQKQAIDDLQKKQEQATNEKIANLQKENEALTAQQQKDLARYKEAELQTQMMLTLQKQAAEEEAKVREEQEAKAAQKAKEKAEKAAQKAQTKADDKELAKAYGSYGRDFTAVLNANSIQEFDTAVAHLTETERLFWDARLKNINNPYDIYRLNTDVYSQENLPKDYSKSAEAQVEGLKKRQMQIAEFTSTLISEAEKQEAAFEKMDVLYKIDTEHPANGRASFIQKSLIDEGQTRTYVTAIEEVTVSLQRMREIIQSMKDGTFDFGNIDALRELFELRQNLTSQMSTMKDADKVYKEAQGQVEAESVKKTEQYKTVLTGLEKQIEKIQTASKTLINPDSEYKTELESAKELLATIQIMIEELNANPLQFMGKDGDKNAKVIQSTIDGFKEGIGQFQEDFQSQQGIQGRINTYFTSYKGAYTSFFREIKDSFKSQAVGELQNEIDRTFKTFEDSITNLNRATGLNQGEFLNKYLDTNGGKASAIQIEQQQKVRNAIAESYRGLITDISNELTKVQDQMSNIFGKDFLEGDFLAQFEKNFTAGLGSADDFTKFQNNAESAKNSLIELQKIQQQMANGELDLTQLAPDELKDRIQEIVKLFTDFNKNYKLVADNAKEFTFADIGDIEKQKAAITQFLKSNRGISSEARGYLQSYFNQLQQGISQADLTKLTDGWHQVADAEQAAGRTGATFMSELQTRFRSLSAYLLSFVSFYRVIGVFKDGINIIHELDDALTEMQKVSDESLSTLREYQKGTFATANEIGTTASQLQQSTADWLRLGEDLQNASQSAQTANILFNVSEFENINDATTALVAMSAAYADAEKDIDKMDIVDRLNLIGNNYAIATDELATALQDGAATLQTAGNDLDEAIALTTAGNLITQDASKTGK